MLCLSTCSLAYSFYQRQFWEQFEDPFLRGDMCSYVIFAPL